MSVWDILKSPWTYSAKFVDERPSGGAIRKHLTSTVELVESKKKGYVELVVGRDEELAEHGEEQAIGVEFKTSDPVAYGNEVLKYSGTLKRSHIRHAKRERNIIARDFYDAKRREDEIKRNADVRKRQQKAAKVAA